MLYDTPVISQTEGVVRSILWYEFKDISRGEIYIKDICLIARENLIGQAD